MRSGDIIFVRGHTPIASIIRWFDKGEFSHVCVAISSTHMIEAQWTSKVRIAPMKYKDYKIVDLGLSESQRDILVHMAIQIVGLKYDFLSILGILFRQNKWNLPNAQICSEVVIALLLGIGYLENEVFLKPNELYRFLLNKKE